MSFDPDMFMSVQTDEASATHFEPVPEGENYIGVIKKVIPRNPKEGMYILDIIWGIDDAALAERLNRQEVTCKQSVFLDMTDAGTLKAGPNSNVALGRLREAIGQNKPGQAWAPSMLEGGGPARLTVRHDIQGEDTYDKVVRVVPVQ